MNMEKEPVSVTVRRIELEEVWFEGLGPLEVKALAGEVELRLEKISKEKNTFDTFKLLGHAALFYAAQAYLKTNTAGTKTKEDTKQLDNAIEKLTNCLNSLPLK
jgi:hypothetical protein